MRRPRFYSFASIASVLLAVMLAWAPVAPVAAVDGLVVSITGVDSESFPYVTVTFTVTDTAGAPVPDLTADSLQVSEDGSPVQPTNISFETIEGDPLSLVLALDASVDWRSFGALQTAAIAMVDSLGPNDQMALIVFSETVEDVQGFTDDKSALKSTIESLVATGVSTALNDAAIRAVSLAKTAPTPRRAVVIVTNSGNNAGTSSSTAAIDSAKSANVPIYTVGYGSNAAASALREMALETEGKTYSLPDADSLHETLPEIAAGFRQVSYKITFFSSILPDNKDHLVELGVSLEGSTGQSSRSFFVLSREIVVTIPGISNGQTVVGKVFLVAEVDSASPVAAVEYLLNGQPIASVTASPYSFAWDSTTVNPGTYQLTARATDSLGNQGETAITVVVSLPFSVQITAPTDRAQLGDDVTLDARVDTPAQIAQVDLLVDDQVVATDATAPYRFTFSTKPFEAGDHDVTVRATDTLGRTAESSLPMRFTAPWWPVVLRGVIAVLLVVAILAAFIMGIAIARAMIKSQEGKLFRACYVELNNTGNARTRFEMRADDPLSALSFEFGLNGSALAQRQVVEPTLAATGQGATTAATSQPVSVTASAAPTGSGPGSGMTSAKQALGFGAMIGGVISSIGYLLPGSLGANLLSMGSRLQTGQAAVNRLERQADVAKSVTGANPPSGVSTPTPTTQTARVSTPRPGLGVIKLWSQTPPIDPGQTLSVTLTMKPVKSKQTQQYFFRVTSQAVDVPDLPQAIEQGKVEIKGLSLGQQLLPWIVIAGTLFVMFVLMVLLALAVGLLG